MPPASDSDKIKTLEADVLKLRNSLSEAHNLLKELEKQQFDYKKDFGSVKDKVSIAESNLSKTDRKLNKTDTDMVDLRNKQREIVFLRYVSGFFAAILVSVIAFIVGRLATGDLTLVGQLVSDWAFVVIILVWIAVVIFQFIYHFKNHKATKAIAKNESAKAAKRTAKKIAAIAAEKTAEKIITETFKRIAPRITADYLDEEVRAQIFEEEYELMIADHCCDD